MAETIDHSENRELAAAEFSVTGMKCAGCEQAISNALKKHPAVASVDAQAAEGRVRVRLLSPVEREELAQRIEAAGFGVNFEK
ncbi:MAG: heavy-metal-associated domain-containing protein [Rhodopirellula sp.]|nr:heavy-metal-associated domain-containing protein [Rhodopirellula sp.]